MLQLALAATLVICLCFPSCFAGTAQNGSTRGGRSRARWTGSKLQTAEYNQELKLIELAAQDRLVHAAAAAAGAAAGAGAETVARKDLLCATFVFGSERSAARALVGNMDNPNVLCDWAVVVYDGDASKVCGRSLQSSNPARLVHCRLVPEEAFRGLGMYGSLNLSTTAAAPAPGAKRLTIPKTVLYQELAHLLKGYRRIMLLDEDISLRGFNSSRFLHIWDCAFYPHTPLIVQPLIAENTQFLQYMNARSWKNYKMGGGGGEEEGWQPVLASATGLVEQQVPAFDSVFFEWFLLRVLPVTRPTVLRNGVDWGHDRTWCNAAQMYAARVLQWPLLGRPAQDERDGSQVLLQACAILTGAAPVHHLNSRSMRSKRTHREKYRLGGRAVVQEYINNFPTWVLLDISRGPDPTHQPKFKKVRALAPECR